MNDFDGYRDEMRWISNIDDDDVDRLFRGEVPGNDRLSEVWDFLQEVRSALPVEDTSRLEAAHVAAMIETSHVLAESGDPVARPASKAHGPDHQASGLPKQRSVPMYKAILAAKSAKIVAIAAAAVLATGGTAFAANAGVLPTPVQDTVAAAAAIVGVDLPDSGDVDQGDQGNVDAQDANVDQGDQGNVDAQDGNVDQGDQGNVDAQDANVDQDNVDAQDANVDQGSASDNSANQSGSGDGNN